MACASDLSADCRSGAYTTMDRPVHRAVEGRARQPGGLVRQFNIVGDLRRCQGVVTAKRIENGQHLVDCDIWAESQREERTALGSATVELPS
jgi:hypothetical protein